MQKIKIENKYIILKNDPFQVFFLYHFRSFFFFFLIDRKYDGEQSFIQLQNGYLAWFSISSYS